MKKIILTMFLVFTFMLGFAQPKYTADAYKLEPDKYLDKEVSLRISSVSSVRENLAVAKALKKEGYTLYSCFTVYGNESGGMAYILVPNKKVKTFTSNYGPRNSKIPYKAVMKKEGEHIYFEGK